MSAAAPLPGGRGAAAPGRGMVRKRYLAIAGISDDNRRIIVRGDEYHHLVHVIRARPGASVTVLDGTGCVYETTVERIGGGVAVLVTKSCERSGAPLPIDIAIALTKAHRLDIGVEKCTEIGLRRFIPFVAERSVWRGGSAEGEHKRERLRRKVVAACKQSGCSHFPTIGEILDFPSLLASFEDYAGVYLADRAGVRLLHRVPGAAAGAVLGIVGPEGGLSERERSEAIEAGASAVSLGSAALRSETAAICLLFRLHDLFDDAARPPARR